MSTPCSTGCGRIHRRRPRDGLQRQPDRRRVNKPSYAIIATEDRALGPEIARRMAERAGSKVTVVRASHAVYISQPRGVARVIESAARAVALRKGGQITSFQPEGRDF